MRKYIFHISITAILILAVCICTPLTVEFNRAQYNSYLHGECKKVVDNTKLSFSAKIGDCHCTGCTGTLCRDVTNVTGNIKCCGDTCQTRYGPTIREECELYNLATISGIQTYMDAENRNFTLEINCEVGKKSCVTADLVECWTKDDELRFVEPRESLVLLVLLCFLYVLLATFLIILCCGACADMFCPSVQQRIAWEDKWYCPG